MLTTTISAICKVEEEQRAAITIRAKGKTLRVSSEIETKYWIILS